MNHPSMQYLKQIFSFFVLIAFIFVQTFWITPQAWADEFQKSAEKGQAEGKTAIPNVSDLFGANDNSVTLYPNKENSLTIPMEELFPTNNGTTNVSTLKDAYGNNGDMLSLGIEAGNQLEGEESLTGEAYRTVRGSASIARPNMRNDPVFNQTDAVISDIDALKQEFSSCTEETSFGVQEKAVHVPDYKTCEKVFKHTPQECVMQQNFQTETGTFVIKGGIWSGIYAYIKFDLDAGTTEKGEGTDNVAFASEGPPALDYNKLCGSGKTDFSLVGVGDWNDRPSSIVNVKDDPSISRSVIQYPSCENGLEGIVLVNDSDTSRTWFDDWGVDSTFTFQYTITRPTNTWLPKSCVDLFYSSNDSLCQTDYTITGGAQNASDCLTVGSVQICPGDSAATGFNHEIPELPLFSTQVKVVSNGCDFNIGKLQQYVDINGDLQQPENDGSVTDTCGEFEDNPQCSFVKQDCVEGARGESGTCYVNELTYDCGYNQGYDTIQKQTQLNCEGPIRCMGEDCIEVDRSASADFARASAALQAAKFVGMDGNCTADGNCNVFAGTSGNCKMAVGGYVDCCKTPQGFNVSLGDYMKLASAIGDLNDAIMTLDNANAVRGAWQGLTEPFTSAWGNVNSSFTSAWEGVWGGTDVVSEAGTEAASLGVKQALMQQTAEWTAQVFGDGAANMLFSNAASQGAGVVGGEVTGDLVLGGGEALIGTALSMVMLAYTIYTVTTILIKIIFKCEQPEFELIMKRELRSCHYVGSYCSNELNLLFKKFCIERKQAYCCFSSPISRILQEQIRPQLGMSWGSPQSPSCGGIPVDRLEDVDWASVNLDEWLGLLGANNLLPNVANIDMESLTGKGSLFDTDGNRLNAADRTVERLQGIDTGKVADQAFEELQGTVVYGE